MTTELGLCLWYGGLVLGTGIIVYTDCRWYWIPDIVVGFVGICNLVALGSGIQETNWLLAGGVTGAMALLYWLYPCGMGSGDVKLMAVLALACPGGTAYAMAVLAFGSAAAVGAVLYATRRQMMLPFGPFLWGGWWLAQWQGEEMLRWLGWYGGMGWYP